MDLCKVIRELDKVPCSLLTDLGISVECSGVIKMEMLVQGVTELYGVLDGLTSTLSDLVLVPLWMWVGREGKFEEIKLNLPGQKMMSWNGPLPRALVITLILKSR